MLFLKFLSLFFGFIIVFRTTFFLITRDELLFSTKTRAWKNQFYCLSLFLAVVVAALSHFLFFVFLLLVPLFYFLVSHFYRAFLARKIQGKLEMILSLTILKMRSGTAFQSSLDFSLKQGPRDLASLLLEQFLRQPELYSEDKIFAANRSSLIRLLNAGAAGHLARSQLQSLRRDLKMRSDFRRKSGRALSQSRAQLLVISILFIGLLFWQLTTQSNAFSSEIGVISSTLFILGSLIHWHIGTKIPWTV